MISIMFFLKRVGFFFIDNWRIVLPVFAGLVLLGLVLFGFNKCSNYRFNKGVERDKQAINAKLSNIAQRETTIANLQEQQAVEKNEVVHDVQELQQAANITDAAKTETVKAAANLANARNANNVNVSVIDLQKKLDQIN